MVMKANVTKVKPLYAEMAERCREHVTELRAAVREGNAVAALGHARALQGQVEAFCDLLGPVVDKHLMERRRN